MRRTRWKLAAGAMALSLGGLAAVADVPSRTGLVSCSAAPPVAQVPEPPPTTTPLPLLPPAPPPTGNVVTPADLPVIPPAPVPGTLYLVTAIESAPMPRPAFLPLIEPLVPANEPQPLIPAIPTESSRAVPPIAQAPVIPSPMVQDPVPPNLPAVPQPTASLVPPVGTQQLPPPDAPVPLASMEKKLKVILSLGDERPRFEVRDGDEVYLKVVCDRVEVKSPSDRGEAMSVLRATGQVTFVTPGGEGMCGELSVVPGSGQVVVTGQASFKYNWGRTETTVSADRLVFRLGNTSVQTPATLPASFQQRK